MRQLKNCKVGNFVRYKEIVYQVNCFFKDHGFKKATLIEVKPKSESCRMLFVQADEKVEHIGEICFINGRGYEAKKGMNPFFD